VPSGGVQEQGCLVHHLGHLKIGPGLKQTLRQSCRYGNMGLKGTVMQSKRILRNRGRPPLDRRAPLTRRGGEEDRLLGERGT